MLENIIRKNTIKTLNKIKYGELTLSTPEGEQIIFKGENKGQVCNLELKDWRVILNLKLKADIGLAADYRDGYWETADLKSLLLLGLDNQEIFSGYMKPNFFFKIFEKLSYLTKRNTIKQSKKNIYEHYDLGNHFYSMWLDKTMTYSSALFRSDSESLEQAQKNKYNNIIKKFEKDDIDVLEVGCGWGGFAEELVNTKPQANIKGITLSNEQLNFAKSRLNNENAKFEIEDYRDTEGEYDYIVSIEMIEAVGKQYLPAYFAKLKSLLKPNGKILIQAIIIKDELYSQYSKGTDMIRTYIFPGGFLPSIQHINKELDNVGLKCTNKEFFGKDYAKTLDIWDSNFILKEQKLVDIGFDKRFQRMWRFYLNYCSAAFTNGRINVVQLEIEHD